MAMIAHMSTLAARVPFLHFFDGFRTSHEVNKIDLLLEDDVRSLIDEDLVRAHRERALNPDNPKLRGSAQNPDVFFQAREACNPFYLAVPGVVRASMERFAKLAGRRYDLILTNPPYVDAADMAALPDEYRHEPVIALASGEQGLDAIIHILAHAPAHLNPRGALVAEVGNSHVALAERFPDVPFVWLTSASGDESVFLLSAEELGRHAARFAAALRPA